VERANQDHQMSTLQDRDLDRSFERLDRSEKYRAEKIGYDATRQATALTRKCLPELIANIRNDRAASRGKALWRALKGISDDNLAVRLFMAGASVAGSDRLGCNRDGHKSFQSTALWISRQIAPKCQDRELQAKIGVWGIEMLLDLSGPVFELRNDDFLVLNGELNDFMDEVYVRELVTNGLLSPIFERPVPWTQVNKGGLPSDHWARDGASLISGHHRKAEAVVRKAIADGKMRRPLNALNYLQSPAYIINERLLAFMKRVRRPGSKSRHLVKYSGNGPPGIGGRNGKRNRRGRRTLSPPTRWSVVASGLHCTSIFAVVLMQSRILISSVRIMSAPCSYLLTERRLAMRG